MISKTEPEAEMVHARLAQADCCPYDEELRPGLRHSEACLGMTYLLTKYKYEVRCEVAGWLRRDGEVVETSALLRRAADEIEDGTMDRNLARRRGERIDGP